LKKRIGFFSREKPTLVVKAKASRHACAVYESRNRLSTSTDSQLETYNENFD